jgi:methyltransferase (TIGR00027 family)
LADDSQPLIRSISDTARWVATYRARETERADALFRDPYARRLAGDQGEEIAKAHRFTEQHSWPMVMRTYLFDQLVADEIAAGADVVVNLAAGLDARPYRLALPNGLRWTEIDFPEVIAYKEQVLAGESPTCRLQRIALDLRETAARRDQFAALCRDAGRAIVLTEGLLIYLSADEVAALGRDLAAAGFQRWITDLASPALLDLMQREMSDLVTRAGAPYRFAPADGPDFFRGCGWVSTDVRAVFRTAAHLHRLPPDLQAFANYPDPPEPWKLPMPWSATLRLAREASQIGGSAQNL